MTTKTTSRLASGTIARRAARVGAALRAHDDLPISRIYVSDYQTSIGVPNDFARDFRGARDVIAWAKRFGSGLIISLSSGANGEIATTFFLGTKDPIAVSVETNIGTAQAYDLGRILQRPLSRDVSIEITADELLAVLDSDAAVQS